MAPAQQLYLVRVAYGGEVCPEYDTLLNVIAFFEYKRRHETKEGNLEFILRAEVKQCSAPSRLWDCIRNTKTPYALQKGAVNMPIRFRNDQGEIVESEFRIEDTDPQYALAMTVSRERDFIAYLRTLNQSAREGYGRVMYRTRVHVIGDLLDGQALPSDIGRIGYGELCLKTHHLLTKAAGLIHSGWVARNPEVGGGKRERQRKRAKPLVVLQT